MVSPFIPFPFLLYFKRQLKRPPAKPLKLKTCRFCLSLPSFQLTQLYTHLTNH
jgi:hypothetical protein